MDVQTTPLDGEPFDLAVSQLGVMFFDEPTAAFGAIRRLLTAGGRFVFACWQGVEHNPWHVGTVLRPLLPPPPVPPPGKSPVGPFISGTRSTCGTSSGRRASGPSRARPRDHGAGAGRRRVRQLAAGVHGRRPEHEGEARSVVERHLDRFAVGPEEYEYPLAFRVFEAVNPSAAPPVC